MNEFFDVAALAPAPGGAALALPDGTVRHADFEEARALFRSGAVLVAHAAFVAGRLKTAPKEPLFDVLELFAFVRPGMPCVPSALGLARALGLGAPAIPTRGAHLAHAAAEYLLDELPAELRSDAGLRPLVHTLRGGLALGAGGRRNRRRA